MKELIFDIGCLLMAVIIGVFVGGSLVTQYMMKNAGCVENGCMLLFDKRKPIDYRKF